MNNRLKLFCISMLTACFVINAEQGDLSLSGTLTAQNIVGNGSTVTNVKAVDINNNTITNDKIVDGSVTANKITTDHLVGVDTDKLDGLDASEIIDAAQGDVEKNHFSLQFRISFDEGERYKSVQDQIPAGKVFIVEEANVQAQSSTPNMDNYLGHVWVPSPDYNYNYYLTPPDSVGEFGHYNCFGSHQKITMVLIGGVTAIASKTTVNGIGWYQLTLTGFLKDL